jgi:type IV pilus assembly protein PilB
MVSEALIGDLLIRAGLIDTSALSRAREEQQKCGISLASALANLGLADERGITVAIAKSLQLESLSAELPDVSPDVSALLPPDFCRKRRIVPLSLKGKVLRLAVIDPMDYATTQDAEFRSGKRVTAVVASEASIRALLDRVYPVQEEADQVLSASGLEGEVESVVDTELEVVDPAKLAKDTKMPPVVRLVNLILSGAAKEGASDIHMEPKDSHLQVRYRMDGLLRAVIKIPKNQQDAAISRMKIISGMDIADRRRPQDGRSRLRFEGKRIDLRVSTLPTHFGEKVVIRLLDSRRAQVAMDQMGLTEENLHNLQLMLSRPQGMVLVTGPTGSGKSSTLYTALNWVKSPTKNIITVEDPVEYQLDGVNQVQINPKAGITFAAGLRSILRQDPNIILVGEIRDQETAGIALEAAQTGHLLLSTLHTNDAPGSITRLLDLGIEPFLISSAIIGILAQRLVRKPCPMCSEPRQPSADAIEKAGGASRLPADAKWVAGRGCEECNHSGAKGRMAIHELLVVNEEVRELITRRASEHAIRKAARDGGMRTLLEDGIVKAAAGLTTLEEVVRVVSADDAAVLKEDATKPASNSPATDQSSEEEIQLSSEEAPAAPNSDSAQPESRAQHRVLVVEDSRTILAVVKYFLELEGFAVLEAKDGEVGLKVAKRDHPDVIVTDCNMPGMDGMAMVREIRAHPPTRDIAVIMLTSENSVEREEQALAAGADDFILKPVEPRRLAARVKSVLARTTARRDSN